MELSAGDVVVVVGRRRRATYGHVAVKAGKKDLCTMSTNMAANLRLRQDDKLKIVPLQAKAEEGEERAGDLTLVTSAKPAAVLSATFAPIEDSIAALQSNEGGDEISDEEIMERFVRPYTEDAGNALIKKGHLLKLRDENGKILEVMVSHMDLEGVPEKEEETGKSN
jgi:hypothetical protein